MNCSVYGAFFCESDLLKSLSRRCVPLPFFGRFDCGLNFLQKTQQVRGNYHGCREEPYQTAICLTTTWLLWLLKSQAKSEYSLACYLRRPSQSNSRGESSHITCGVKCLLPSVFGKLSLSKQLLALVHFLSRCYAAAALSDCCTVGVHTPTVLFSWLSM